MFMSKQIHLEDLEDKVYLEAVNFYKVLNDEGENYYFADLGGSPQQREHVWKMGQIIGTTLRGYFGWENSFAVIEGDRVKIYIK